MGSIGGRILDSVAKRLINETIDNLKKKVAQRWWSMKYDGTLDVILLGSMITFIVYVMLRVTE
jgi:hypothetical protein